MQKLTFSTLINAPASKVWQVLWNDITYRQWTSAFHEGSYAVSDWNEGSSIHFLSPDGNGMYSVIEQSKPQQYMAFKHIGEIKNFEEQPLDEKSRAWTGGMETYTLSESEGVTKLLVELDAVEEFSSYFSEAFPKAMERIKAISEKPVVLETETLVNNPIDLVWLHYTTPEHIMQWNNASPDWHTPRAENDLRPGGKFSYRMEARDGSFGFDFGGVYDIVVAPKQIDYTLGDGRKVHTLFSSEGDATRIKVQFDAEDMNSYDLQKGGWQAILDNFKRYCESHSSTK